MANSPRNLSGIMVDDQKSPDDSGNKLYIRNIPSPSFNRYSIKEMFSRVGRVVHCYVHSNPDAEYTYGFVQYEHRNEALMAIKTFDQMDLNYPLHLSVSLARPRVDRVGFSNNTNYHNSSPKESICKVCGSKCTSACSACQQTFYCSVNCQKIDFITHKKECNGLKNKYYGCRSVLENSTAISPRDGIAEAVGINDSTNHTSSMSLNEMKNVFSDAVFYSTPFCLKSSLINGDQYDLNILKISKKKCFYGVINEVDTCSKMSEINESLEKIQFGSPITIKPGLIYCVSHNSKKYRARPICRIGEMVRFSMMDYYSKVFVPIADVAEITDSSLLDIPGLCICGTFATIDAFDFYFSYHQSRNTDIVSLKFIEFRDGLHIFSDTMDLSFNTSCCLNVGETYEVQILFAHNWNQLIFRSSDNLSRVMYTSMAKSCCDYPTTQDRESLKFDAGDIVRCKAKFNRWQRAKVMQVNGTQYDVYFIDTGEYLGTTIDQIDTLPSFLKYIPPLVFCGSLDQNLDSLERYSVVGRMKKQRDTHVFDIRISKKLPGGMYIINELGSKLLPTLTSINSPPTFVDTKRYNHIQVPIGADLDVYICNYISPREFYVHLLRKDFQLALNNLHLQIDSDFKGSGICYLTSIEVDTPVMCFSQEKGWFRSIIVERLSDNDCKVLYVDFGIKDQVSLKNLAKIPEKFMKDHTFAVKCRVEESDCQKISGILEQFKPGRKSCMKLEFTSLETDGSYTVKMPDAKYITDTSPC